KSDVRPTPGAIPARIRGGRPGLWIYLPDVVPVAPDRSHPRQSPLDDHPMLGRPRPGIGPPPPDRRGGPHRPDDGGHCPVTPGTSRFLRPRSRRVEVTTGSIFSLGTESESISGIKLHYARED